MKRTLLIIVVLCLGGILLAATSVLSSSSYGLFGTPIDAASSAGQGFLDLDKTYIFGGLANLEQTPVIDTTSNAGGTNSLGGVELGAYFDSERPWSLFTDLFHDSTTWTTGSKSTTNTYTTKSIGLSSYDWVISSAEKKTYGSLAGEINDSAQYLTELNGMVVGGRINLRTEDRVAAGSSYKETSTFYYDAAAASSEPDPKVDYTVEKTNRLRDQTFSINAYAPIFIPSEKVDQSFSANIGYEINDNGSVKISEIYSTPVKTAMSQKDVLHKDEKNKTTSLNIGGSYRQSMASPFMDGDSKDFHFSGSLGITFHSPVFEALEETQVYTYALSGTTMNKTKGTYDYESSEIDYGLNTTINLSGSVGHRFEFDLGEGFVLGFHPVVSVGVLRRTDANVKSATIVEKEETGPFDGVVDVTTTTTYEFDNLYYDASTNTFKNRDITTEIGVNLKPSCAFKYQPNSWKVGFTLGTQLDMSMKYTTVKSKVGSAVMTATVVTGGSSTTTEEKLYGSNPPLSLAGSAGTTHTMDWVATLNHSFSMNWDIAENATLYADLGATVGSGIFDIGNLTVQAVISLP